MVRWWRGGGAVCDGVVRRVVRTGVVVGVVVVVVWRGRRCIRRWAVQQTVLWGPGRGSGQHGPGRRLWVGAIRGRHRSL